MLGLLDDTGDGLFVVANAFVGAAQRDLAFATDDGERGAQLVADIGKKPRRLSSMLRKVWLAGLNSSVSSSASFSRLACAS